VLPLSLKEGPYGTVY